MKRHALLLLALTGCPDNNTVTLWLAPDQMETAVKLVTSEPRPY